MAQPQRRPRLLELHLRRGGPGLFQVAFQRCNWLTRLLEAWFRSDGATPRCTRTVDPCGSVVYAWKRQVCELSSPLLHRPKKPHEEPSSPCRAPTPSFKTTLDLTMPVDISVPTTSAETKHKLVVLSPLCLLSEAPRLLFLSYCNLAAPFTDLIHTEQVAKSPRGSKTIVDPSFLGRT